MQFPSPPLVARFQRRYKRFFVDAEMPDGTVLTAHCANTGSLMGCLEVGARVWLRDSGDPKRKLRCSFQAIEVDGTWVNVDTSLPNRVVREAFEARAIAGFEAYPIVRAEVKYGTNSRIDVLLEGGDLPPCYVEVKNTTLAQDGWALFPDAVTERGLKHLGELTEVVRQGGRAVQLFFVSRADVRGFRPADSIDPAYAEGLRLAARAGVEVRAFTAQVGEQSLELGAELPVDLGSGPLASAVKAPRRRAK
ncbi:MAG: DNA/RNA nuclease SfsA [Planctomycetaceae bacterium]|nr:DNA/RNA nuclease SfsA [Planctomycetaceae bacterium]